MWQNGEKKFQFKRKSSVFNSKIFNIKFKSVKKESIIVTITRNPTCHIQTKTEVRLCGQEVGTGQKFVTFWRQKFDCILYGCMDFLKVLLFKKDDKLT